MYVKMCQMGTVNWFNV